MKAFRPDEISVKNGVAAWVPEIMKKMELLE